MIRIASPCKDCEERVPLCHSKCMKYKAYRENLDDHKARYFAAKEKDKMIVGFEIDMLKRVRVASQANYSNRLRNKIKEVNE